MCNYSKNLNYSQLCEIIGEDLKSYFTINFYFIINIKFTNSMSKFFCSAKGGKLNAKYKRKPNFPPGFLIACYSLFIVARNFECGKNSFISCLIRKTNLD